MILAALVTRVTLLLTLEMAEVMPESSRVARVASPFITTRTYLYSTGDTELKDLIKPITEERMLICCSYSWLIECQSDAVNVTFR